MYGKISKPEIWVCNISRRYRVHALLRSTYVSIFYEEDNSFWERLLHFVPFLYPVHWHWSWNVMVL